MITKLRCPNDTGCKCITGLRNQVRITTDPCVYLVVKLKSPPDRNPVR